MRLPVYIQRHYNGNVAKFAQAVGFNQSTCFRWALPFGHSQHVTPSPTAVLAIFLASGGRVTPNDLYPLPVIGGRGRPSRLVKRDVEATA